MEVNTFLLLGLELIHGTPLYYKANLLMFSSSNKLLYLGAMMHMRCYLDTRMLIMQDHY